MTNISTSDAWDPAVYQRFEAERAQPFHDLLALCRPIPAGRAVDLGCGTGHLTAEMHRRLQALETTGIDSSPAMLAEARPLAEAGLTFRRADISDFGAAGEAGTFDLVFSNAALHWVALDHKTALAQWARVLKPGGQLAVQMPANSDHPSHRIASEVAAREPFLSMLGGEPPADPVRRVLPPEAYAEALYDIGFPEQQVRLQVYGHVLPRSASVVEWVSGTSLTRFKNRLSPEGYASFLDTYRAVLLEAIGDQQPYFYAFKRILLWARR